jgi:hypothetical protein
MTSLFFSYSREDEDLSNKLEVYLSSLKRQGMISMWHDRRITVRTELRAAINENLNAADVILLLVSLDFINSDYCYEKEMDRPMERRKHEESGEEAGNVSPVAAGAGRKAPLNNLGWTLQDEDYGVHLSIPGNRCSTPPRSS